MSRREVRIVETTRPFEYVSPFPGAEHTLLVCAVDESVTGTERAQIAAAVIAAKCRYAVCWGHECSAWDTATDWAYLETDANFDPPDESFVMTTWHEDEPIEETIKFWWGNTCFDDYESTKFAVLVIGEDSDLITKIQEITSELCQRWNRPQINQKAG